jgi:REP element-mobilizing transposase RayT
VAGNGDLRRTSCRPRLVSGTESEAGHSHKPARANGISRQGWRRYQSVASSVMKISQIRSRGRLPHWEESGATYFVTFRLADSLPKNVFLKIEQTRFEFQAMSPKRSKEIEKSLDAGAGACLLARNDIAEIIAHALRAYDGTRYRLLAWCVMPNHVHVVFQPIEPFQLSSILHSWKSYSAQIANRILGRKGPFWQREYFDRLIRDGDELGRAIAYTAENPSKAGLKKWKWLYVSKGWS